MPPGPPWVRHCYDHNVSYKRDPPFKDIRNCGKAESRSPLAIYTPHPEKILVLHLCKDIAGSGPMFLCYTD